MKRSGINLAARFKKASSAYAPKPLMGVLLGTTLLSGCGDDNTAYMYYTAEDCVADNPGSIGVCQAAYQNALDEAAETSPKYRQLSDCESDFGLANCTDTPPPYRNFGGFMPLMAGFMIGSAMFDDDDIDFRKKKKKKLLPMFSSYNRSSPFAGRMVSASGIDLGRVGTKKTRVRASVFSARPSQSQTVSRGGFGRTVASSRVRSGG